MRVCLLSENVSEPSHFNMNHGVETVRLNSWFICAIKGYLDRGREGWQPSSFENVVGEYQPVTNSKLSLPAPMQGQQSERTSDREGDERQIRAKAGKQSEPSSHSFVPTHAQSAHRHMVSEH
jgi:hypothetical protein